MRTDGIKGADGIMRYNPNSKTASYCVDVRFAYKNITKEQAEEAKRIINEKDIKSYSDIYLLFNHLAKAGFRGEIQHTLNYSGLQLYVVIDSKID
ncbi:MAG: hypothetical protein HDS16_05385 [Bacteroides sp.]|nr:hypothetical protein [Bacteroides sp.]